jgi:hypothetical protein
MGNRQSIVPDSGQIAAHLIRLLGLNEVMNDMNQMFNKADIIFDRTQRAIAYFEVLTLVMIGYVTFLFILRVREKREGSVHGGLHLTLSPSSNTSLTIDTSSGASQMKLTFHTEAATTKQEDTLTKMVCFHLLKHCVSAQAYADPVGRISIRREAEGEGTDACQNPL